MSATPRHVALNALFLDPGRSGGPETYLRGLVPALAAEFPATRFTVVTTRRGIAALREDGWTDVCSLLALPADEGERLRRLGSEQVQLPVLAGRRGWDLVHSLASVAPVRLPVRAVITLHDVTFFHHRTFGLATTVALRQIVSRAARHADGLITGSAAARDDICTTLGLPPERFAVVPHGAGRPPGVAPLDPGEVRRRRDLPPDARVVLCVAAIRPHKNQEVLVRALATLPSDVVLVLAGHPEPYVAELERVAAEAGVAERLRIAGYVDTAELEGLWRLAACAAFPTLGEGFGLPVAEAMGRGVPVACSDIPVLREVGGAIPRYFAPRDPAAAARAVAEAMAATDGGDRAVARAARFSWAEAARGTFDAYRRAMA